MFGDAKFESTGAALSPAWDAGTVTCEVFREELGVDLRGMDLQLVMEALTTDTWKVEIKVPGTNLWILYDDNFGAGNGANGIVLIDDVITDGIRVTLAGAAATDPILHVTHRRRGMGGV
jgi:hypothetical protein